MKVLKQIINCFYVTRKNIVFVVLLLYIFLLGGYPICIIKDAIEHGDERKFLVSVKNTINSNDKGVISIENRFDMGFAYGRKKEVLQWSKIEYLARYLVFSLGKQYEWNMYFFTQGKEDNIAKVKVALEKIFLDTSLSNRNLLLKNTYHVYMFDCYPGPAVMDPEKLNKEDAYAEFRLFHSF